MNIGPLGYFVIGIGFVATFIGAALEHVWMFGFGLAAAIAIPAWGAFK